ncbi:MAG TPA: VWA domain-containing protein [Vicinamibacterales bacterium]|nr:VWA domain-containing protein [Vicinamibacterales bacterium]
MLVLIACGSALVAAQQPGQTPVFRSGARLNVVDVTVTDKQGKPIDGLTANDFVLTEDGEPQTISQVAFQRIEIDPAVDRPLPPAPPPPPRAASAAPAVQPTIAASTAGAIRYRDRRLIVLYFDLSSMPPPDQMRAFTAARKYLAEQIRPQDLVAILTFQNGAVRVKTDFNGDRAALQQVVETLIYGESRDASDLPDQETDVGSAFGQDDAEFNILNTDRQLSALQTAATMLRSLPEQKSLVYFSSGLRLNGVDNQAQLRATINAATRANVAIFPVDARGLVAEAPLGDATQASPRGIGMLTGQSANTRLNQFQRSQDTLYALAKDTGGKALFDNNDLSQGIVQASQSLSSYYILGYTSTHPALDGKFHRVKVALRNGLAGDLAYREGYFADREFGKFTAADKERQLEEALMLENPVTDIPVAMEINYFQLNRAEYFVPVSVKIPGSELALARRRGAARTEIDFIGEVKDDYGVTMQNVRDKLDIKLTDQTAQDLAKHPVQYETGFTLLPGKYVIKVLARDAETGRIGTYQANFTIPNLNRETARVPISSVVLGSQRVPLAQAIYSVKKDVETVNPLVFDGAKLLPSVTRVFSKSKDLYVFLQAYERSEATTQPLVAFVTFYRGATKALETAPLAIIGEVDPKTKAMPLRFSVPLDELAVGRYDVQVSVLEPGESKATFWRAPVVVVP